MTIKHIQARFTSGNEIPIDKAMVPADEWRTAMAEIQVLKDEYICKLSEVSQLQEQNTYLDKVSAELQDLCDRQAKRLAEVEKDAARLDHVLKWDDGYWTSRLQIDKCIADDADMENMK